MPSSIICIFDKKKGKVSGIYIHVPFCRQRCYYCDFYSTTQLLKKPELVQALIQELELRKTVLEGETVKTIYFGGGTPSLLTTDEINRVVEQVYNHFLVDKNPEITLEANPDDLSEKQIYLLSKTPVNRLSIGIQSFNNDDLISLHRRHNAQQAIEAVKNSQAAGFNNISIDLIYGLPTLNREKWQKNLEIASQLNVQHISAYHLTYEKGTVFDVKRKKGEIQPIAEEESLEQFKALMDWAKMNDFIHYEISNFGKSGYFSQHNTSYWMQKKYLGIGPSAHSYSMDKRSWNVSNLAQHIAAVNKNHPSFEEEVLTPSDKQNEYIITALRTRWGIKLDEFETQFGALKAHSLLAHSKKFIDNNTLYKKNNALILTDKGVFVSDAILAELMEISDE